MGGRVREVVVVELLYLFTFLPFDLFTFLPFALLLVGFYMSWRHMS